MIMWKKGVGCKVLVERGKLDMTDIKDSLGFIHQNLDMMIKGIDSFEKSDLLSICGANIGLIAEAYSLVEMYLDWFKEYNVVYEENTSREDKLKVMVGVLQQKIKTLEADNVQLREIINTKEADSCRLVEQIKEIELKYSAFNGNIEKLLELFNKNLNTMVTRGYLESKEYKVKAKDRALDKAPRYNGDVDNEMLVNDYRRGLSTKELAVKYGMTDNGIRNRLKLLKVWEPKR